MSTSWPSPMLVKLVTAGESPLSRSPTDEEVSWIVSLGFLIGIVSNIIGSTFLDIIGRKYCILACSVPKLAMAIILIFSTEVWLVILARAVMVMGDCFVLVVVPIYTAEIASKELRGALGVLLQGFSSLGILITLSVGPFVSYYTYSYIICGAIVVATMPLLFLPETPYYLISKGKTDAALETLTTLRHSETDAKIELEEYRKSIEEHVEIDKKALFKDKTFLKALALCVLMCGGSQLVGYNAVSFYLQTILISAQTNIMPEIASVIISVIQVVSCLSLTVLTSIFQRKRLLVSSLFGIFVGMMGLGTFFQVSGPDYEVTGFMNYLPIISLILVVFCYSAGIGALLWPTATELFEGPTRAFGTTFGLVFSLLTIFLTAKYFPIMTAAFGPASTYWFFSVSCFIIGALITMYLPETKDKTFREIQVSLGKKDDKKCPS
ncbi:facilitated trehalose transporter Tret1-like isoform X2 [Colias croceus]|nr:facilitated trehalose transporter Tret1-like isoform X2 [Colias croceus]